ncbi:COG2426 family protein [Faecalicatena contorta]|uniref:COG2426 family protein n=1 Tax=Faecalicatena contorta TaxID=39482 RepID=UPI001F303837|nr:small multi-drug export protein [Faecalicatena contorta]MCF2682151.1 small multi-drug export protein [Faecalicatena contorta]
MTESLVQGIINALSGSVSKEVIVFLISMIPILELRGALLVAGPILGVPVSTAIPLCIIGNIIPVPFILLLITPIFRWMKGTKTLKPMVDRLEAKAMSKSDKIEKYEFWGLVLFVGIPLPGTGAWTGSLIAALLGIKFKKAFPAVIIGICMATVIMWFISYVLLGGVHLLG